MEHNEEIIREKIRQADATAAVWNKETVWLSIVRRPNTKSRQVAFYYIAASIVLAITLIFVTKQQSYQKELLVKLAHLELAIEQQHSPQALAPGMNEATNLCIEDEMRTNRGSALVAKTQTKDTPALESDPVSPKESHEQTTLALLETDHIRKVETDTMDTQVKELPVVSNAKALKRVAAIFGVEKNPVSTETNDKKLRVRFVFMEPYKDYASRPSEPMNILATINQK